MRYVFVKMNGMGEVETDIINDPVAMYKSGEYDEERGDRTYQLGPEIKIEINIRAKTSNVQRNAHYEVLPTLKTEDGYNG
jgi:hypothetical protein